MSAAALIGNVVKFRTNGDITIGLYPSENGRNPSFFSAFTAITPYGKVPPISVCAGRRPIADERAKVEDNTNKSPKRTKGVSPNANLTGGVYSAVVCGISVRGRDMRMH